MEQQWLDQGKPVKADNKKQTCTGAVDRRFSQGNKGSVK